VAQDEGLFIVGLGDATERHRLGLLGQAEEAVAQRNAVLGATCKCSAA